MEASSKLISFEQVDISKQKDLISYLDIENKKIAVQLERVRLGDGEPIAYDITWMPIFYGQLIEGYNLEETTIFKILEDEFDIPIEKGCYRIEASMADDKLAKHLNVDPQTPLLLMNRISYTIGEKPVYYQKRYYRNDKMVFELMAERRTSNTNADDEMPFKEMIPVFKEKS